MPVLSPRGPARALGAGGGRGPYGARDPPRALSGPGAWATGETPKLSRSAAGISGSCWTARRDLVRAVGVALSSVDDPKPSWNVTRRLPLPAGTRGLYLFSQFYQCWRLP